MNHTHRLNDSELKSEFDLLSNNEKRVYSNVVKKIIRKVFGIDDKIITTLKKTSGNINYDEIANHIGGLAT